MAVAFYTVGETKTRPGVYNNITSEVSANYAGVRDGVVACVIKSNWGPLDTVTRLSSYADAVSAFGNGGTVGMIKEIFDGGASQVLAVRCGSGGTKGKAELKDSSDSITAKTSVTVTAKYVGGREFKYQVKDSIGSSAKEFIAWDGTKQIEKIIFAKTGDMTEAQALVEAGKASMYFDFSIASPSDSATGVVAVTGQDESIKGTDPGMATDGETSMPTCEEYSNAFILLETREWNVICIDSNDTYAQSLLVSYIERLFNIGKLVFGIVGEPEETVEISVRQDHARAYNNKGVVYVGNGWIDVNGIKYTGYLANARIAGLVASVSSANSLVHTSVTGAVDLIKNISNADYEDCINSGMLMFSISSGGVIWIENANTTLVNPSSNEDEGWKKIKRTKIRYELLNRANETVEPLVGKVNNDTVGQSAILSRLSSLISAMVSESKLLASSSVTLDENNPPQGDSAWYVFNIDDVDALEKVYMKFKFRFSSEA